MVMANDAPIWWFLLNPFGLTSWYWGHWHPICHLGFEVLGYVASFYCYKHQTIPDSLSPAQRKKLKWWTLGGAIVGAKLVPFLETVQTVGLVALLAGKSLAGGLLGGIVGSEVGKWRLMLGTASTGDVLVYPLLLGSVVGRLGCSCSAVIDGMVGIPLPATWQAVAPYWGALVVNTSTVQHVSTKVTQLLHMNQGWAWNVASIEIVGLVVIALALRVVQQHYPLKTGQLFYSFCLGYFMLRLGLDELKQIAPVLTVVQWFSVVGIVWSVYRLWYGCYVRTEESKN